MRTVSHCTGGSLLASCVCVCAGVWHSALPCAWSVDSNIIIQCVCAILRNWLVGFAELCELQDGFAKSLEYDAKAVDVWACGVVLYAMLTNGLPWTRAGREDQDYQLYVNGNTR